MLITDPKDYRIGDFVLFDGAGPTFNILAWLLARFDPSWKKLKRKPWHTAFLSGKDDQGDWWVGESKGGVGPTETALKSFKDPYQVFRWFDTPPDEVAVMNFIADHKGEKYDNFFGYLFVILWYFLPWWPLIVDRQFMCWEFLYLFALQFGKPVDKVYRYPLITILMDKVGYPDYD